MLEAILSSSSAGYGDDLIVTVISIQVSMACNILLRNRPRVGRYRITRGVAMAAEGLHGD